MGDMVTEKEAEERARYRRTADALGRFLARLEQYKPGSRDAVNELPPPDARIRGARQLIQDALRSDRMKDWLPDAVANIEAWADAETAATMLRRINAEIALHDAVFRVVGHRETELWQRATDAIWPDHPHRPNRDRIEVLEDMRRLSLLAAGEALE